MYNSRSITVSSRWCLVSTVRLRIHKNAVAIPFTTRERLKSFEQRLKVCCINTTRVADYDLLFPFLWRKVNIYLFFIPYFFFYLLFARLKASSRIDVVIF